jgi:membrane protease YdiL (CAAX protease family)
VSDETIHNFSPKNGSLGWQGIVVALLVVLLILSTYASLRRQAVKNADAQSNLLLESIIASKQAFFFSMLIPKSISVQQKTIVDQDAFKALKTFARNTGDPEKWLELSLLQYYLSDTDWKASLRNIGNSPSMQGLNAAAWQGILENKKLPAGLTLNASVGIVRGMKLGWYRHLALSAIYNAGADHLHASEEMKAAMVSVLLMFGIVCLAYGGGFIGFALLVALIISIHLHKQNPENPLPAILTPYPPEPLNRKKGDLLYAIFIIYLLSFLLMRYLGELLVLKIPAADRVVSNPIELTLALTLTFLSGLIPVLFLVIWGRRVGLKASDLGYRRGRIGMDMLWGVGGYLMSLPIVLFVSLISAAIFRHVNTPNNPAILAFTDTTSPFLKCFMFLEAALIAPFAEETMFRAVFFRGLSSRMNVLPAMLIASLVFAILHPQLPLGFAAIFVIGFTLNALFYFRGSIAADITAHALNNSLILLFLFLLLGR